jgi:2-amino-4-hydroxy-6-hydroxymethyldihydropteridine diphosphokinase
MVLRKLTQSYVALGGNIGNAHATMQRAIQCIVSLDTVVDIEVSRFYRTAPESDLPQNSFINAVCRFNTVLTAKELFKQLQQIEISLGKIPKPKNAPRVIDLDLLFYGYERHNEPDLEIPHPRWLKRLFVLIPLLDLTNEIVVPSSDDTFSRIDIKSQILEVSRA